MPRRRTSSPEESDIATLAQLITASLTEPTTLPFDEFFESRITAKTRNNPAAGRSCIAAVRRVYAAGRLTDDEAFCLVHEINESVFESRPITYTDECFAFLRACGEPELAEILATDPIAAWKRANVGYEAIFGMERPEEKTSWSVSYPSPDAPLPESVRVGNDATDPGAADSFTLDDDDSEDDDRDDTIAAHVTWWHDATGEGRMWTVSAVLAFAFGSGTAEEPENALRWIESIQIAHEHGYLDADLNALALYQVASGLVDWDEPVMRGIEEQMEEMGTDSGSDWDTLLKDEPKELAIWHALRAAQVTREDRLIRKILEDCGEEELAREMGEQLAGFKARIARSAEKWGVDL